MTLLTPVPMPDMFTGVPQTSLAAALRLLADQRLGEVQEGLVATRTIQPDEETSRLWLQHKMVESVREHAVFSAVKTPERAKLQRMTHVK